MNNLPSITLLQQESAKPLTGEDLEIFGKEAANKYTRGEYTLTEAVVETVKKAGLSPEQVKRVAEFANTDAFLQEFRKEGESKVVEFDGGPADYSEILKDLNDGGGGTVFDTGSDYKMPPPNVAKTASRNMDKMGTEETKLAEAFSVVEKPLPYNDPYREAMDMRDKLASAYANLTYELSQLELEYADVGACLVEQVKQAALSGVELGQIVSAWSHVSDEPAFVKAAFSMMTPRLVDNEVFPSKDKIGESLLKTANAGVVNRDHPMLHDYERYCSTLLKLAETRAAQEEAHKSLGQMVTFLKKTAGKTGWIPGGIKAITGAAKDVAPHAERFGKAVGGETVGKVLGTATKYSPHAAAALGAEEVYQRTKRSPVVQGALGRVPGTTAYYRRQYKLAQ